MKDKQTIRRSFDQVAVKAMASMAKRVAEDSVNSRCFMLLHKPEEPSNLDKRLKAMQ